MKKTHWPFFLILVIILTSCHGKEKAPPPQPCGKEYYEETGHKVSGEFLETYCKISNPNLIYGYPITNVFLDTTTGNLIQYFQKARFEFHSEAPQGQRIKLTPLGQYLYIPGDPAPVPDNTSYCRLFSETGYQVCNDFLTFFEANGGIAQFGYPISNPEFHTDRIVQYFQLARFEWSPEFPAGQRVTLSDLGYYYFQVIHEDVSHIEQNPDGNIIKGILTLKARAFPQKAVTGVKGLQAVYVVVQDQRLLPVSNAQITLLIHMPGGEENRYIVPALTDANGMTQYAFPFNTTSVGIAQINVTVTFNNIQVNTVTSFRVWW